jgi:hypothetical protein
MLGGCSWALIPACTSGAKLCWKLTAFGLGWRRHARQEGRQVFVAVKQTPLIRDLADGLGCKRVGAAILGLLPQARIAGTAGPRTMSSEENLAGRMM